MSGAGAGETAEAVMKRKDSGYGSETGAGGEWDERDDMAPMAHDFAFTARKDATTTNTNTPRTVIPISTATTTTTSTSTTRAGVMIRAPKETGYGGVWRRVKVTAHSKLGGRT